VVATQELGLAIPHHDFANCPPEVVGMANWNQDVSFIAFLVDPRKTKTCKWRSHKPLHSRSFSRRRLTGVAAEIFYFFEGS
jgi:hypothetical protein